MGLIFRENGEVCLHAMTNGVWGAITDLADKYIISRTFVYSLAKTLKEAGQFLFGETAEFVPASSVRELSIEMMLSIRLVAQGSIGAASTIMKQFGCADLPNPTPNGPIFWTLTSHGSERRIAHLNAQPLPARDLRTEPGELTA
jgi:hypothetical protein